MKTGRKLRMILLAVLLATGLSTGVDLGVAQAVAQAAPSNCYWVTSSGVYGNHTYLRGVCTSGAGYFRVAGRCGGVQRYGPWTYRAATNAQGNPYSASTPNTACNHAGGWAWPRVESRI